MLPRHANLPSDLIPLPGFDFRAPLKSASPEVLKNLAKGMIQIIAAGLMEFLGSNPKDMQFVSLITLDHKQDEFTFDFYCPYLDLVKCVQSYANNIESAVGKISGLSINYKMAMPVSVRLPMVFVYQAKKNELLVSNENHFSRPEQFLDPEACRVTSGFLNFLGTLLMLNDMNDDDDDKHMKSILARGNTAIKRDLDEWLRWLYCLVDRNELYNTRRILVVKDDPERYFYDYPSKQE